MINLFLVLLTLQVQANPPVEPIDNRVRIPAAPENGIQVVTAEITLAAHEDKQFCWYYTMPNDVAVNVIKTTPYQGFGGHHMLALVTNETQEQRPDGTLVDCTMGDSRAGASFLPLLFPNGPDGGFAAPQGYAAVLPAHVRLVFQFHYHNHNDQPIIVRDVMNIEYARAGDAPKPMATWTTATADFRIPANSVYTKQYSCPIAKDMDIYIASGHVHERATNILIEIGNDTAGYSEFIRADNIDPYLSGSAGIRFWDPANPFKLRAGDKIRVTCTWNNTLDHDLVYPEEMCGTFAFHLSGAEPLSCLGN
jgi:hypothetical protein